MKRHKIYLNRPTKKGEYCGYIPKLSNYSLTRNLSGQIGDKGFDGLETLSLLSELIGLKKFSSGLTSFLGKMGVRV